MDYSNGIKFIFNNEKTVKSWSVINAQAFFSMGHCLFRTLSSDPRYIYTFKPEERFDAADYKYFAVHYRADTIAKDAYYFAATDKHPSFSNDGGNHFPVVSGKWQGEIIDMSQRAFWEGTVTAFRFDIINSLDLDADILIERMGFFRTYEQAQAFLADANTVVDYSRTITVRRTLQTVYIPGGTLSDGYKYADYVLGDTSRPEGDAVVKYTDADGNTSVVALSHVNSIGHATFVSGRAGKYTVGTNRKAYTDIAGRRDEAQINFVSDRELFACACGTEFMPDKIMTCGEFAHALEKLDARAAYKSPCAAADEPLDCAAAADMINDCAKKFGCDISVSDIIDADGTLTRAQAAVIMERVVKAVLNIPYKYKSAFKKDRIMIGAWSNLHNGISDETISTFANAGLDLIMGTAEFDTYDLRKKTLELADKYGLQLMFHNYLAKYHADPGDIPFDDSEFYDHPSFIGHHLRDEPGTEEFDELSKVENQYHSHYPDKIAFFNLLPIGANAAQLKYGARASQIAYYDPDPDLYRKYIEAYAQQFRSDYMCVDIYPVQAENKLYNQYCKNLDIFSRVCRKYDKTFWMYVQSVTLWGSPVPTEQSFRWQYYTAISFGVRHFIHYHYGSYNDKEYSFLRRDGSPTTTYYAAQKANAELRALSDTYVQYNNVGAFSVNASEDTPYLNFENQYKDSGVITGVNADKPLLVGCFEKNDGQGYAFTLVNMTNFLQTDEKVNVTFTLKNADKVTSYVYGKPQPLTAVDGVYSVTLDSAQGVFVTAE